MQGSTQIQQAKINVLTIQHVKMKGCFGCDLYNITGLGKPILSYFELTLFLLQEHFSIENRNIHNYCTDLTTA